MPIFFESAYEAVFLKKFGKGNKPLFKNQLELANAIIANPESGFQDKNAMTIRSAISQIFTGERNLSKNLKYVLFLAIKQQLDSRKYDYSQFEKLLLQKLRDTYEERLQDKRERAGDRDFDSLMFATKNGTDFLITTLEPAELHKSELADRLKNQLLEKTGIVQSSEKIQNATYKFYLPEEDGGMIARDFWEALQKHAVDRYGVKPDLAEKKLQAANKKGVILTYLVPTTIAMNPYVFINHLNKKKVVGFCVSYRDKEIPSVAELSTRVVYKWFEQYTSLMIAIEKDESKAFTIY